MDIVEQLMELLKRADKPSTVIVLNKAIKEIVYLRNKLIKMPRNPSRRY